MGFLRTGMLAVTLVALLQIAESPAQPLPVVGYVAAKNENPKRLEVFKKGLAELGYGTYSVDGDNCSMQLRRRVQTH